MSAQASPTPAERSVIWHDAECGGYQADLPLWHALAQEAGGPVLDLGCGTGRVSLELARSGHGVTAVDRDGVLLDALRERAEAAELAVETAESDVRDLRLGIRSRLAIAPMQLVQLLPSDGRREALLRVRGALARGGRAAFAIVEGSPEPAEGDMPLPDVREVGGWIYSSQPVSIDFDEDAMIVRRLRQLVSPDGDLTDEEDEVRLSLLTADELEAEAEKCGMRPAARHTVKPTQDHVGSTVIEVEAT